MQYIVVALDPVDGVTITGYWNGSIFQPDINLSDVMSDLPNARFIQGSVQSQSTGFDVEYREATVTVALV